MGVNQHTGRDRDAEERGANSGAELASGRGAVQGKSEVEGAVPEERQAAGRPRPGEGTYRLIRVDASKAGIPGDLSG